jgi:hypothetical protein
VAAVVIDEERREHVRRGIEPVLRIEHAASEERLRSGSPSSETHVSFESAVPFV